MGSRGAVVLFVLVSSLAAMGTPDQLTLARRYYNQGQLEQALTAAREAAGNPKTASSARLVIGRIHLERYRQTSTPADLDEARKELRLVDRAVLDARELIELQVGLAALLYYDERYGPAAELLAPIVESSSTLAPDAHARALDWWATALDRQAQAQAPSERGMVYFRITERMEAELRRDPSSGPANYWLTSAARSAGDLDRAWSAAMAGWIRASLAPDRGAALRGDLDRLMLQAIIPDRAARLPQRERRQAQAAMTAEWDTFKSLW
ncbi:MAG TPA: hypothetical protein VFK57_15720 [Vicinamibacterales bacterium]|nr:hypothetical protein [Vicinamibacterales bacterium]